MRARWRLGGLCGVSMLSVGEVDNDKMKTLFEMGTNGAVSGDCFVKIAYEEPYKDTIGRNHPGRVRILPLNSAYVFPEYHPTTAPG